MAIKESNAMNHRECFGWMYLDHREQGYIHASMPISDDILRYDGHYYILGYTEPDEWGDQDGIWHGIEKDAPIIEFDKTKIVPERMVGNNVALWCALKE